MTEQIQTHPKSFEVSKWFGPQTAQVILPDDALDALIKMTDNKQEYAVVVGTLKDAEYMTRADTLSHAKAKAIRFMLLVLNDADIERLKWKI